MAANGKQATGSGFRDLAIMGAIVLVLLSGIGLIVSALMRNLGGESDPEAAEEAAEEMAANPVAGPDETSAAAPDGRPRADGEAAPSHDIEVVPPPASPGPSAAQDLPPERISQPVPEDAPAADMVRPEPASPAVEVGPPPKPIDPGLAAALEELATDDPVKVSAAIAVLRRFNKEGAAFEALCAAVTRTRSDPVRVQVLRALAYFKDFNPSSVCVRAMKSGDEEVVKAGIDLAGEVQFAGHDVIFVQGLKHRSQNIRRHALRAIRRFKVSGAEKQAARVARYDADKNMQREALAALCALRSKEALSMLRNMLAGSDKGQKSQALNYLRTWGADPAALDLLTRYRNDKDLGEQIRQHLAAHGR